MVRQSLPRPMIKTRFSCLAALAVACASLFDVATAAIPGMKVIKLVSPEPGANRNFGSPCVLTDRYAVVADSSRPSENGVINHGRVRVYDAVTGKLLRTLKASYPTNVTYFGRTLAVHGNLCLVGCYTEQVFLFDLNTGKQLRTFINPGPDGNSFFGQAMQLTERHAIIVEPGEGVYVYELANTNAPLALLPPDPSFSGWYGISIYAHNNVLLVGQLFPDASNKGVVLRYDLTTGQLLGTVQPPDGSAFDRFGVHINGTGQTAFVSTDMGFNKAYPLTLSGQLGAPFNLDPEPPALFRRFMATAMDGNLIAWWTAGDVVLSDLAKRERLMVIKPEDLGTDYDFSDIGLASNRLLIAAAYDDGAAVDAGAVFLIQTLLEPLPGTPVAIRGDSAPGAAGIYFNDLQAASINPTGRVAVASSLSGAGSNLGKDRGVFDDLAVANLLDLAAKSRDDLGSGLKIASVDPPVINDGNALFAATLGGTGVTSMNNRSILRDNGTAVTPLLRTGDALTAFGGATLASLGQIAQSGSTGYFGSIVKLRSGVGGTTLANDSGLLLAQNSTPNVSNGVREGTATNVAGVNFGQFVSRVSYQNGMAAFTAMVSGTAAQNQALFTKAFGGAANLVVRKGDAAPGITGGVFSSFLSENVTPTNTIVFRAKVSGSGITAASNEGLWHGPAAMPSLIARTGSPAPGMQSGVVWSRFLQVCPQNNRILIRALLRGTGVKASNDEILYLYQEDGSFLVIYREGDGLPGQDGLRGGPIRRLEANVDGSYGLLVSLVGARTSTNLALLCGSTVKGSPTAASSLRRPEQKLRKGTVYATGLSGRTTLTTIAFANKQSQDATGMGCKGLPHVTSGAGTLVRLTFSDRGTQIVKVP